MRNRRSLTPSCAMQAYGLARTVSATGSLDARLARLPEAGCGTGAILRDLHTSASRHGLDLDPAALTHCRLHAPAATLTRGNGLTLPYPDQTFDIVYCHFFLLWVSDPLQAVREMKRVTRPNGHVLALAEPDYFSRVDKPDELKILGEWQRESLQRQGADPGFGSRLAGTFFQAGINLLEAGTIQGAGNEASAHEREMEWAVLKADLAGFVPEDEIQKMKLLDEQAWERGERILHVPTYFAWGRV
ncbi:class I SAM-dependent methyltransferase [Chloroflexi bacterium CFX6]|nr:class I SAM-dependent methyltransferase [Chloroflexi bacterium CFX6]